jgi:predicted permease
MRPPRLAEWLLARRLRRDERTTVLGDFEEEFRGLATEHGAARATVWYWREVARLAWGLSWWTPRPRWQRGRIMAFDDMRYAVRRLRKQPLASAASAATLACAIGAAAATWSLVSAVLLNPLRLPEPDRLMEIGYRETEGPSASRVITGFNYPSAAILREAAPMPMAAWGTINPRTPLMVTTTGEPVRRNVVYASHDLMDVLGLPMSVGRFFTADEDRRGAPLAAVLSDRFWRAEFQADPSVVGRTIRVRDERARIVGVAPPGFTGLRVGRAPSLFMPLQVIDRVASWEGMYSERPPASWVSLIGRLPDEVTREQVEARLNGIGIEMRREGDLVLTDLQTAALPESSRAGVRQFSQLLGSTVALLLAIGSLTVGMLLVLRTEARRGELAMCLALGASRRRLAAGVAVEGLLLAGAGAVLALPVSQVLFAGIRLFELPGSIRVDRLELALDDRVLTGSAAAAAIAVLLMALVASAFGARPEEAGDLLRAHAGATPRLTRRRSRTALVTAQVAVTLVLVTGAGLFARSVSRALALNPGIDTSRIFRTDLDVNHYGYDAARTAVFVETLLERLDRHPAIASVAVWESPGGRGEVAFDGVMRDLRTSVSDTGVDGRFFETIGLPITAGRPFNAGDRAGTAPVAIVSASLAREIAGDGPIVGREIDGARIVGVVPELILGVGGLQPFRLYRPFGQHVPVPPCQGCGGRYLHVRASGDVRVAMVAVTDAVRAIDPQIRLDPMRSMEEGFLEDMAPQRFGMTVMGALGGIALLLSVLGAWVLAESMATERRREMGIRAALGASGRHLRALMLSETCRLVGFGLIVGVALSWFGAGTIRAFLFQVEPLDPVVLGTVALLIAVLALGVSLRPALAATRLDLARLLRED